MLYVAIEVDFSTDMGEDILGDEGSSVKLCINVTTSLSFNTTLILSVSFIDSTLASKRYNVYLIKSLRYVDIIF